MKFRACVKESIVLKEFSNILISLSKLSKECTIQITDKYLCFIIPDPENNIRRPFVWCQLVQTYYFREYSVCAEEDNEIFLEINPIMLAKSISVQKTIIKSFKLQLTNKQSPCLTLEIETAQPNVLQNRKFTHDVPVEVKSKTLCSDYIEPNFDNYNFDITFTVPSLKNLRNITDRMKNINNNLLVTVSRDNRLALKVRNQFVQVTAHFPDSINKSLEESTLNTSNMDKFVTCIDVKKFVHISNWCNYLQNYKITFHLATKKCLKMDLEQTTNSLFIQCILPHIES